MSTERSPSRTPPRPSPSSLHKAIKATAVAQVVQQLPQDARRKVQRLKLESRHLSQLHVLKGAAQAMLTTSELALQMQPDDAEVFHLQAELSEIQTKLKLVVEGIDKKEAISLNNVVAVASNLLDLKDETATPEDRPQNFFRHLLFFFHVCNFFSRQFWCDFM